VGELDSLGRVIASHKTMFKRQDEDFDEMIADPIRRRAKIADLSKRRILIFWCAVVISVCAIVEMWSGGTAAIGGVFAAAVSWSIGMKMESDLRLLRVIERLQKDKDEKTTA
jgi:uncharacterized membrane protein